MTKIHTSTTSRRAEALRSTHDRNHGGSIVLTGSLRSARRLLRACPTLARRTAAIAA